MAVGHKGIWETSCCFVSVVLHSCQELKSPYQGLNHVPSSGSSESQPLNCQVSPNILFSDVADRVDGAALGGGRMSLVGKMLELEFVHGNLMCSWNIRERYLNAAGNMDLSARERSTGCRFGC